MYKVFALLLFLLPAFASKADCANSGLYFWPRSQSIQEYAVIMIEGYGMDQETIEQIGTKHFAFLKSGNHRVKLVEQEYNEGTFELSQKIFRPEEKLIVGRKYVLHITGISNSGYGGVTRWNEKTEKHEPVSWKVVPTIYRMPPALLPSAKHTGGSYTGFGCGPAIYSFFELNMQSDAEFLVRTTLKDLKSGQIVTYYIHAEDNKVLVGHGMCSGAFKMELEHPYEISFSLLDATGKGSKAVTNPIQFKSPSITDID